MLNRIRTCVFYVLWTIFSIVYPTLMLLMSVFPFRLRYAVMTFYSRVVICMVRYICGVRFEVVGKENIPKETCIVLANHQSTWETFAFQMIFPMQTWVVKRQLLGIPFFGWAFALLQPIAIDRNKKVEAMDQLLSQGAERLKQGRWVIVFPEGTRTSPGQHKKFSKGGAKLAVKTQTTVIPVAHNSGSFWGAHSCTIRPGLITVFIGNSIDAAGKSAEQINDEAQTWIQDRLKESGQ